MSLPGELYTVKFAEYMQSIKFFYLTDERFKAICDQYCDSKSNTLKYRKKITKYFNRQIKYENLSHELEEEILIYLIRKINAQF
jgi:hypothetical protein